MRIAVTVAIVVLVIVGCGSTAHHGGSGRSDRELARVAALRMSDLSPGPWHVVRVPHRPTRCAPKVPHGWIRAQTRSPVYEEGGTRASSKSEVLASRRFAS